MRTFIQHIVLQTALAGLLAAGRLEASAAPAASPSAPAATATNLPVNAAVDAAAVNSLDDKYKLAIGDKVSFRILEDGEDSKPLVVTDSGELEAPYIGRVAAVGKTCTELAATLKAKLEKDYYYHATVIIAVDSMAKSAGKSPGKVYVAGAVHLVGAQEIPADETFTVGKCILRAGGFSEFADKRHVRVTRKGTDGEIKILTVNVADVLEPGARRKGTTDQDLPLEPEDFVFVPDKLVRW